MSAMPEAKLTGRNTCNDAKTSARKATRQTRLRFRKLPTGHPMGAYGLPQKLGDVSSSGSTSDKPMQEIDPASGNSDVDV